MAPGRREKKMEGELIIVVFLIVDMRYGIVS